MNNLKHKEKIKKRNMLPASLISTEYVAMTEEAEIKGIFNTEKEFIDFCEKLSNPKGYIIKTFKINNTKVTIKQNKEN